MDMHNDLSKKANKISHDGAVCHNEATAHLCGPQALCTAATVFETSGKT